MKNISIIVNVMIGTAVIAAEVVKPAVIGPITGTKRAITVEDQLALDKEAALKDAQIARAAENATRVSARRAKWAEAREIDLATQAKKVVAAIRVQQAKDPLDWIDSPEALAAKSKIENPEWQRHMVIEELLRRGRNAEALELANSETLYGIVYETMGDHASAVNSWDPNSWCHMLMTYLKHNIADDQDTKDNLILTELESRPVAISSRAYRKMLSILNFKFQCFSANEAYSARWKAYAEAKVAEDEVVLTTMEEAACWGRDFLQFVEVIPEPKGRLEKYAVLIAKLYRATTVNGILEDSPAYPQVWYAERAYRRDFEAYQKWIDLAKDVYTNAGLIK